MLLYVVQDSALQSLYSAIIIAENEREAKQIARVNGFTDPVIVETHELTKGFKTVFAE